MRFSFSGSFFTCWLSALCNYDRPRIMLESTVNWLNAKCEVVVLGIIKRWYEERSCQDFSIADEVARYDRDSAAMGA